MLQHDDPKSMLSKPFCQFLTVNATLNDFERPRLFRFKCAYMRVHIPVLLRQWLDYSSPSYRFAYHSINIPSSHRNRGARKCSLAYPQSIATPRRGRSGSKKRRKEGRISKSFISPKATLIQLYRGCALQLAYGSM